LTLCCAARACLVVGVGSVLKVVVSDTVAAELVQGFA